MLIGHKKQWEFLKKKFELNQLSHAYLFIGYREIGKRTFAKEFAEFIGCKFPDLMLVEPEGGKEISIKKIREVQNFLAYKSYHGGFKVVTVDNAEKMNQEAQSCFLKTLEEPKGKTLIILISSKPDMLLPTIISRCQTIKFLRPKDLPLNSERLEKDQEILKDLMPIINSNLADKFKYAKSIDFEQQDLGEILEVMQKYFRKQLLDNISDPPRLGEAGKKAKKFLELSEEISKNLLFTNANPKLALEILLMETGS